MELENALVSVTLFQRSSLLKQKMMAEMKIQHKDLTVKEFSGHLQISSDRLYQMALKGNLPSSKIETTG